MKSGEVLVYIVRPLKEWTCVRGRLVFTVIFWNQDNQKIKMVCIVSFQVQTNSSDSTASREKRKSAKFSTLFEMLTWTNMLMHAHCTLNQGSMKSSTSISGQVDYLLAIVLENCYIREWIFYASLLLLKKKLLEYSWSWMSLISSFQQKFLEFMLRFVDTIYIYIYIYMLFYI